MGIDIEQLITFERIARGQFFAPSHVRRVLVEPAQGAEAARLAPSGEKGY